MAALRLFFAVPVPAAAAATLDRFHAQHRHLDGWRWPPKRSWHLTVAFLGNVDDAALPILAELGAAAAAQTEADTIRLTRLEWWPSAQHPRLLVATGEASPALRRLNAHLSRALARQNLPFDERPLRPHVTLARLRRSAHRTTLPDAYADEVAVASLALYRSEKGPAGSDYRIIWQTQLGG